ncbi:MAG: NAD(P)/FAD-dependent oxidoreductase [Acidobacteriota bacterium]
MRAVVVGGGIVGAACARQLEREGFHCVIVERDVIGSGATAAGMGHVVVMDDSEAQFALTRRSRDLWDAMELPDEVEFERCGTLWVAADEEELEAVRGKLAYYRERGVEAELLDARRLYEAERGLRAGMAGGFLVPGDSVIYAPCAAAWLGRGIERKKAEVLTLGDGWVELRGGERLEGDIVLCATGAWAAKLTPGLEVKPRKGHLAITDRYPGAIRHQLIELGYLKSAHGDSTESVAFNVQPRRTGQLLIGSSRQYGVEDGGVERHILERMLRRAVEYLPGLAAMQLIRVWAGFRAATPDKLPIIGLARNCSRTWLATGHEGLGITTCLGTAELLADLVMGRGTALRAADYAPGRFA